MSSSATSDDEERRGLLIEQKYDVTNCCFKWGNCGMGSMTLVLEREEVILIEKTCLAESNRRMPYGELGSVDHATACGCCHSFSSNLNSKNENGQAVPFSPGFGCDGGLVQKIVTDLKARMKGRGDTGNINRAEEALDILKLLMAKVDALSRTMAVPSVQVMDSQAQKPLFEHKEYNVTNCCTTCCTCGMAKITMNLEPEEAVLTSVNCCATTNSRRPYGELGSVSATKQCCGCHSVTSGLGGFSPGWGCDEDLVDEIVAELKVRMKERGDTGNIQRQEITLALLREQDAKLNAIMQKLNVPVPQAAAPKMKKMA